MKNAVKAIPPEQPIFGVDTEEVEGLRQLEKSVGDYLLGKIDVTELESSYWHLKRIRRAKRHN